MNSEISEGNEGPGPLYPTHDSFELTGYDDADYACFLWIKKSTPCMTHFLRSTLISWGTKKQSSVAFSAAEAKYVDVASCSAQLLWIKQQLEDYGVLTDIIPLMSDNTTAINMSKSRIQTKEDEAHRCEAPFSEGKS